MRLKQLLKMLEDLKAEFRAWLDRVVAAADRENRGLTEEEAAKQTQYEAGVREAERLVAAECWLATLKPTPERVINAGPVQRRVEVAPPNVASDPFRGFREGDRFAMGDFALAVRAACGPGGPIDQRLVDGGLMRAGGVRAAPTNYHQETGTPRAPWCPRW